MFDVEMLDLTNGKRIPKESLVALDKLEESWPGATFHGARPAIVAAVMDALRDVGYMV